MINGAMRTESSACRAVLAYSVTPGERGRGTRGIRPTVEQGQSPMVGMVKPQENDRAKTEDIGARSVQYRQAVRLDSRGA